MNPEDRAQLEMLAAEQLSNYKCVFCGNKMFFSKESPTQKGQVYSAEGYKELGISGSCEHCFDNITNPEEW